MTKTYKELMEVDTMIGKLYKADPLLKETKFGHAYNKFYKENADKVTKELQERLIDLRIDNALEDETTKAIIRDEKSATGFAHSKDQLKKLNKEEKELLEKFLAKEIEVIPYISSFSPELTDEQKEILTGLII